MSDLYEQRMPRCEAEAERLDEQYSLHGANLGYDLHPSVEHRLPADARIADIATGTGIFLRRIAPSLPDTVLHGYDISATLYPPKSALAPNIDLRVLDAKQPIPLHLQGQYDVVHVRNISMGLMPDEWPALVANLVTLLKPGGVLQWVECDALHVQHLGASQGSTTAALETMYGMNRALVKSRFEGGWTTLPGILERLRLVDVEHHTVGTDRVAWTRSKLTANSMTFAFLSARAGKAGDGSALSGKEIDRLEEQVRMDIESGGYLRYDIHCFLAVKPHLN
ncbi:class I SAM-dependent methyltransferase [Aspergillus brunneoviolaceus CBS 621.78]|uniref:Uncharacterized protein n=1 Tax=Aspergillus brunneoviolaceus CBS 621.78 TaxID=1450534 RepID=A0ACD1GPR1_9EURO|nr:hypothetical protein BO95DRAFT_458575 [Aspergillus brunneoviolaceus CBS 621.78]RAH51222.1 hypothetical protein BO95DRAFT_458575 [Aspergillus brunneoviolaceus CBS 621.78]